MNQAGSALLDVSEVSFCYGKKMILDTVGFSLHSGEYVSLVGKNGSGKSTLMKIISGYEKPFAGQIRLNGIAYTRLSGRQTARQIAVINQVSNYNFPYTCYDVVRLGLYPHKQRFEGTGKKDIEKIEAVMALTDTLALMNRLITQVSGGERQKVILAKALIQRPKLLLIDEGMSELDLSAKIHMTQLLKQQVKDTGLTVLIVNHGLDIAYQFSSRIIAMGQGKLIADGPAKAVMTQPFLQEVFGVKAQFHGDKGFYIYDTAPNK